jgi:hypothetical protein
MKIHLGDIPHTEQGDWQVWLYGLARWTWWTTLTFEHHTSRDNANGIARRWLRYIARDLAHNHVAVFCGAGQQTGGRWHFHMMLGMPSVDAQLMREADTAWKQLGGATGYTHIERFDEFRGPGAINYIRTRHEWSPPGFACPRTGSCAHRRCRLGTSPLL